MDCDNYMKCNTYLETLVGENCTECRRRSGPPHNAAHIAELDAIALTES